MPAFLCSNEETNSANTASGGLLFFANSGYPIEYSFSTEKARSLYGLRRDRAVNVMNTVLSLFTSHYFFIFLKVKDERKCRLSLDSERLREEQDLALLKEYYGSSAGSKDELTEKNELCNTEEWEGYISGSAPLSEEPFFLTRSKQMLLFGGCSYNTAVAVDKWLLDNELVKYRSGAWRLGKKKSNGREFGSYREFALTEKFWEFIREVELTLPNEEQLLCTRGFFFNAIKLINKYGDKSETVNSYITETDPVKKEAIAREIFADRVKKPLGRIDYDYYTELTDSVETYHPVFKSSFTKGPSLRYFHPLASTRNEKNDAHERKDMLENLAGMYFYSLQHGGKKSIYKHVRKFTFESRKEALVAESSETVEGTDNVILLQSDGVVFIDENVGEMFGVTGGETEDDSESSDVSAEPAAFAHSNDFVVSEKARNAIQRTIKNSYDSGVFHYRQYDVNASIYRLSYNLGNMTTLGHERDFYVMFAEKLGVREGLNPKAVRYITKKMLMPIYMKPGSLIFKARAYGDVVRRAKGKLHAGEKLTHWFMYRYACENELERSRVLDARCLSVLLGEDILSEESLVSAYRRVRSTLEDMFNLNKLFGKYIFTLESFVMLEMLKDIQDNHPEIMAVPVFDALYMTTPHEDDYLTDEELNKLYDKAVSKVTKEFFAHGKLARYLKNAPVSGRSAEEAERIAAEYEERMSKLTRKRGAAPAEDTTLSVSDVYAHNREVAKGKAAAVGKLIAAYREKAEAVKTAEAA